MIMSKIILWMGNIHGKIVAWFLSFCCDHWRKCTFLVKKSYYNNADGNGFDENDSYSVKKKLYHNKFACIDFKLIVNTLFKNFQRYFLCVQHATNMTLNDPYMWILHLAMRMSNILWYFERSQGKTHNIFDGIFFLSVVFNSCVCTDIRF